MKKKQLGKHLTLVLAAALCFGMAAGCGGNDGGGAQTPGTAGPNVSAPAGPEGMDLTFGLTPFEEPQKLRIAFLAGALNPYIIADQLGVFDALNIEVEFICFSGGPAEMEANAEWDIATAGGGGLCIGTTAYDMHIIDIMDYEDYNSLWARPGSPLAEDPADPENWKVEWIYATGTTCQAVLAAGLQSVGLTLEDITAINVDLATTYTAFDSGTADAMATNPFQSTYAEAAGYTLVGNGGTLGFCAPSGTVASAAVLESKMDLVATAVAVAHLTNDWIYAGDENLAQAAAWFYQNCEEEGYNCDESTAAALAGWYRGPKTAEWLSLFTDTAPDQEGLYSARELLHAENDILDTLDFFINEGKYTAEDRNYVLDHQLIDGSVAKAAKELLDRAGAAY